MFRNCDFTHIHQHTTHSKFDGAASINKAVMKAREMGFPALACTDHGTVAAAIKFIAECGRTKDKKGNPITLPKIKPLVGCEFYLARDHTYRDTTNQPDGRKGNRHLIAIAKNWKGYQNLCALSQTSWVDGFYHSPRIDIEMLAKHREGLIISSACLSSVINASLLNDKYEEAKAAATLLKDLFGRDFYLEVMFHGIREEAMIIPEVLKLGNELDIPVLASNDNHYVEKSQAKSQEVLMCFSTNKCVLDPKHLHFPYDEFYMKSADEMGKMFGHHPELLYNTVALAESVDADDIERNMGGMRLPKFKLPPEFKNPQEYLEHLAWRGMKKLNWHNSQKHIEALNMELHDVRCAKDHNNYDFATYFLIVWGYINSAREKGILTGCGRGSGYASVLLRTLGICYGPDPLEHGLIWERFLGFDNKRFYLASDFGLEDESPVMADIAATIDAAEEEDEDDDIDAARELDDDLGGVDRY